MNLFDRMAYYNVKGINLTVVNNGNLVLNEAYGLSDANDQAQMTIDT